MKTLFDVHYYVCPSHFNSFALPVLSAEPLRPKNLSQFVLGPKGVHLPLRSSDGTNRSYFEEYTEITDNSHVMAWLTYEVVAFYLNIISVVFFLAIASFKIFKTIRERLGLAGQHRKKKDFLTHC